MKKILILLISILLVPLINAQQTTDDAGVTPDSFLWGLDKAIDQLNLLLTFDKGEKAKKGIEIARERLLEVREMVEENKLEAAEKAKDEHGKTLVKVKQSVKELEEDNSTEEIKEVIEIEKELEEHEDDVEDINTELKVKIKIEGTITEEQKALINSLLDSLKGQTGEVEIEIKNKKDKTKIKIKQETGKSDIEIENEIEDLEEEIGLEEVEVKTKIIGNQAQIKIENEFSTEAADKNAIIDEIIKRFVLDKETVNKILKIETEEEELEKDRLKVEAKTEEGVTEIEVELRFTLSTTDREAIVNEVVAKSQLSREDIEKVLELKTEEEEKEEEELEIEVEIEDGVADVKIEIGDDEQEFTLETTDKEAILSEIASRLGVTVEQIRNFVEFEEKEKGKTRTETRTQTRKGELCTTDADCNEDEKCVEGVCIEEEGKTRTETRTQTRGEEKVEESKEEKEESGEVKTIMVNEEGISDNTKNETKQREVKPICSDECFTDTCSGFDFISCEVKSDGCKDKLNQGVIKDKCGVECLSNSNCNQNYECRSYKCIAKPVEVKTQDTEGTSKLKALQICYQRAKECSDNIIGVELEFKKACNDLYLWTQTSSEILDFANGLC